MSPGTRIGPYEILAPLGAGGMGEVYKARDTRLDRSVAIKVLPSDVSGDSDLRARFEREARAVAALDHPHICGIFDVGETKGTHFLVMPYLDGQTLAGRLAQGSLPLDQALRIAAEIADALDKAHRHGIVHRDLKPANIMLTKSGSKLLDFGLAKLRAKAGPISLSGATELATRAPDTARGMILGTVHYMSPEQVEGKEADSRSDIWAFGVLLYEMVAHIRPFRGETPASIIGSILKDEPPSVSTRQPLAPSALDQLVNACLAKDPEDRWQSMADVTRQLQWIAKGDGATRSPLPVPKRRSIVASAASIVAAALAGAVGLWLVLWSRPGAAPAPQPPVVFTIEAPAGLHFGGPPASISVPQLAVSPNGRHVAFVVENAQGQTSLWVRSLDEAGSRPLAGTEDGLDPFWSADSEDVGFLARGVVKRTGIRNEGSPLAIGRGPVDSRGGAWNRGGTILFYSARSAELSKLAATGGAATPLSLGSDVGMARWPEFLPDGESFLFQTRHADLDRRGVYLGRLSGNGAETRRLIGSDWMAHYGSGYVLFLDGSTLMAQPFDVTRRELGGTPIAVVRGVGGSSTAYGAFSVSTTGVLAYTGALSSQSEVRWIDRSGYPGNLVAPKAEYVDLNLSPDQARLAYSRLDPQSQAPDVWILDMPRGTSTRITSERLLDASPIWSPNGDEIIFRSNRTSAIGVELYLTSSSPGGTTKRILALEDTGRNTASNAIPCFWTADGQVVFYMSTLEAGYGIWTSSIEKKEPKPLVDTQYNEVQAALSPDGRWMAFASDLSGRFEIYVQDFPAGAARTLVSANGGMQPRWRGDGRELYFLQGDGSLMEVAVKSGPRFDASAPALLFKTELPASVNPQRLDYVPAADGRRFLMKLPVQRTPPAITVVLNWPSLLTKTETSK